jgi:hypothetical protein
VLKPTPSRLVQFSLFSSALVPLLECQQEGCKLGFRVGRPACPQIIAQG